MIFFYAGAALIFLEIAVFVAVADAVGFFTALLMCFFAGVFGVYLVQRQGLGLLSNLRSSFERGEMPLSNVFDAACIMAAGILMILPGFVSDFIGFILLIPFMRGYLRRFSAPQGREDHAGFTAHRTASPDNGVIDGDFVRVSDDTALPRNNGDRQNS